MGRVYTATRTLVSVTTADTPQDVFEITAPADACVVLHSAFLGQSTLAGDASSDMVPIQIVRYATGGSGGGTATPRPHAVGDPAFGGVVETGNTMQGGTPTLVLEESFNIQAGWYYTPTPEERIVISPSGILAIALPADFGATVTLSARVTFEEVGG